MKTFKFNLTMIIYMNNLIIAIMYRYTKMCYTKPLKIDKSNVRGRLKNV